MNNSGMSIFEIADAVGVSASVVEYAVTGDADRAATRRSSIHQPIIVITPRVTRTTASAIKAAGSTATVVRSLLERAMERVDPETVVLHETIPPADNIKLHVRISRPLRDSLRAAAAGRPFGRFVASLLRDGIANWDNKHPHKSQSQSATI